MNYYSHHIGDFNNATRHLNRLERAIYRDMLDLYYDTESPLMLDLALLCRRLVARSEEEAVAVEQLLKEFFVLTDAGWFHARCDQAIRDYQKNTNAKSLAGKASAAKRAAEKHGRIDELNAPSTAVERQGNAASGCVQLTNNRKPITRNHKPVNQSKLEPALAANTTEVLAEAVLAEAVAAGGVADEMANAMASELAAGTTAIAVASAAGGNTALDLCLAFRQAGVKAQAADPRLLALVAQGATVMLVQAACAEAKSARPDEIIGLAYVLKILERWGKQAASMQVRAAVLPRGDSGIAGRGGGSRSPASQSRHNNFEQINYNEGIENGRII
ncbi:YdaU family protein [Undibacterium sp. CY18W]|uniref:YdaU family protein n=1 Tax=Undibacterium hunanense TaxID=2762292 RepID=A0ABR6ZTR6_9BURK|nr:YdaU family protein [Undibacterium hunanense]MBC3919194.1 YdaU family protein [Undibacterium hunanense]